MSIYGISDLHLSFNPEIDKPMDIYGDRWYMHWQRLETNWRKSIMPEDTVIIAGDVSWGLKFDEATHDLNWIDELPGKKVIIKGNHDLWWSGITRMNQKYDSIRFLQNDFYFIEDVYICGTRGWITPDNDEYRQSDERVYKREILRLEASLEKAKLHRGDKDNEIIGVLHYPPCSNRNAFSGFQEAFERYGVKRVFYGHIHGEDGFANTILGNHGTIEYQLISVDYLNCDPLLIEE